MSRSKWKFIISQQGFTQSRNTLITPGFINKTIKIHNGKELKSILIQPELIGHKFGEFIYTKITPKYKASEK